MEEQLAAYANLFRACAVSLRRLAATGMMDGASNDVFDAARQSEQAALILESRAEAASAKGNSETEGDSAV